MWQHLGLEKFNYILNSMKHCQEVRSKAKLQILINEEILRMFFPFESKFLMLHLPIHFTSDQLNLTVVITSYLCIKQTWARKT